MAKSLRSKWKRKMRAAKRERYGEKELIRLKKMLGINTTDVEMKEENIDDDIVIVKDAKELKRDLKEKEEETEKENVEEKEVCEAMDDGRRVFNKKTLKDQHGSYPVWLSSKKLKKVVKQNKKIKRNQKKKTGKKK